MRHLSQTKAAKLAGVSRGTIANRIDAGALSCTADGIDPAELVRVFPDIDGARIDRYLSTGDIDDVPAADNLAGGDVRTPATFTGDAAAIAAHAAWLQGLVDEQRAILARKDLEMREALQEADERAERREAALSRQIDQLTALLPPPAPIEPKARGFVQRLFGR